MGKSVLCSQILKFLYSDIIFILFTLSPLFAVDRYKTNENPPIHLFHVYVFVIAYLTYWKALV